MWIYLIRKCCYVGDFIYQLVLSLFIFHANGSAIVDDGIACLKMIMYNYMDFPF